MGNKRIPFEAGIYYHVYNHGNANDTIFRSPDNYYYFLRKYEKYISPIADTYAYCLMPNHFHLLLKIKEDINPHPKRNPLTANPQGFENLADLEAEAVYISRCFSNFLNAYAKAFNKMYHRRGSLFLDNIKRKAVLDDDYFTRLIYYIHYNAVHHGFVKNIDDWTYSSYKIFLSDKPTFMMRKEVLDRFGGSSGFKAFHQKISDENVNLENEFK